MAPKQQETPKRSAETNRSQQGEQLDQQQVEHPAAILRRAYATPGTLNRRDILRLQRTIGNRAVIQLMRAQTASATQTSQQMAGSEQIQRTLARGSGWGVWGWTGGTEGKTLWERLEKRFNTDFPQYIEDLKKQASTNPFFASQINVVVGLIEDLLKKHTTVAYSEASALDLSSKEVADKYTSVIKDLGVAIENKRSTTQREVNELINRLKALNNLKIKEQVERPDYDGRRSVQTDLQQILSDNRFFSEGEKESLSKRVSSVETSFQNAAKRTQEAETKRLQEEQQRELARQKQEAENLRQQQLSAKLKKSLGGQFGALSQKCGGDLDLLDKLVAKVSLGDIGKLNNALGKASADELLELFAVHSSSIEQLNNLLMALSCPKPAVTLKTLLGKVSAGQEAKLLSAITAAGGDAKDHLKELLDKVDVDTLISLLGQGDTDALKDLLITKALNVGEIKTLLATTSKGDVVYLLQKIPEPALLNKFQALATSPAQLHSLVTDIARQPAAVNATRTLLNKKGTPATLNDILTHADVMKARGLKTNANATIGETTVSSLTGTGEQAAVQATLNGISTGKYPTLTHANGAKFGDDFDNNQGRLPGVAGAGGYKEYYVEKDPASASYHGDRRLVVSNTTGHVYYTDDHYATFKRIQ